MRSIFVLLALVCLAGTSVQPADLRGQVRSDAAGREGAPTQLPPPPPPGSRQPVQPVQPQPPLAVPQQGQLKIISGDDLGFRVDRYRANGNDTEKGTPLGTLMVRIDGKWVEAGLITQTWMQFINSACR
jgi:hypothetical protein